MREWGVGRTSTRVAVLHDIDDYCLKINPYGGKQGEQEAAVGGRAIVGVNRRKNSKSVSARDPLAGILSPKECFF